MPIEVSLFRFSSPTHLWVGRWAVTVAVKCRLLRGTMEGEVGATSISRPVLLPEVRRVQRAALSCASSWSSHSAWGLYARGKVRRSHGWTDCGKTSCFDEDPSPPHFLPWDPATKLGLELTTGLSRALGSNMERTLFEQWPLQLYCTFRKINFNSSPRPSKWGRGAIQWRSIFSRYCATPPPQFHSPPLLANLMQRW
jgi:hypothetical protein